MIVIILAGLHDTYTPHAPPDKDEIPRRLLQPMHRNSVIHVSSDAMHMCEIGSLGALPASGLGGRL